MERRTKIVATIGPASQDEATIHHLTEAGMDVARLNFSHGKHEEHAAVVSRLRRVAQQAGRPVCVLQDLQGPKIRTANLPTEGVELIPGETVSLTTLPVEPGSDEIPVDFPDLARAVVPGGRILLDDGNLELRVISSDRLRVRTTVVTGGILKAHKGINLPGARLDIPSMTEKDEKDLAFGLREGIDAVALSFVRSARDIYYIRQRIARLAPELADTPVIAKLERPEALDNLEEIVRDASGVMVARGDLGVEMSPQEVPIAQKRIIECANRHGKLVITATQMLDSMIHNPRPTRAEASDVANAILDGTDAVMLSGETAVGAYPVQSVEMMGAIICQAEAHLAEWGHWHGPVSADEKFDDTYYMTLAARELAHDRNVAAIAVFTKSGRTALLMSKTRPSVPILAFTPEEAGYHRLAMYWGVQPYQLPHVATIEAMVGEVEARMMAKGMFQPGQQVVLICGFPVDQVRPTNLALLHTIGNS
ncbi:MAG: pyruvate kinase [Anaerolineales bacterium]|nr:pyruvate kinase [Anaerolineales bacterium]